ncbi:MAG: hypothetical protein N3E37_04255 [Candidatus Micrarchaeota archaeon]|nr:hypothetical protein [Candidatus Micrarchaeota archaeon]
MATCGKCGKHVEHAHYYNGIAYCMQCAILAENDEAQCASCGMYLPKTEMKMWASRYYCNYCIMDIMDEEERKNKPKREFDYGHTHKPHQDYYKDKQESSETVKKFTPEFSGNFDADSIKYHDRCERCGIYSEVIYVINGKKFCRSCIENYYKADEHKPSSSIVNIIKKSSNNIEYAKSKTKSLFEKIYEFISSFGKSRNIRKPLAEENKKSQSIDKRSVPKKNK